MSGFTEGIWRWRGSKLEAGDKVILEATSPAALSDARLIENAPQMYKALIFCYGYVVSEKCKGKDSSMYEMALSDLKELDALLARIGGEDAEA